MIVFRIVPSVIFLLCGGFCLCCGRQTSGALGAEPQAGPAPTTVKPPEVQSAWKPLQISSARSAGVATLMVQEDGSIVASGMNPDKDVYTVAATTKLTGITAVQIEVIPDEAFGGGSGRGRNNNLVLTKCCVKAAPADGKGKPVAIALAGASADFSQKGWPVAAAIEGKPDTGWAIDPEEGKPHAAVFRTARPVGFDGGTVLTIVLEQGFQSHNIGRFRLWATTVSPVPPPCTTPNLPIAPVKVAVASEKKEAWTLSTRDTELTVGVDSSDQLVIYKLINPEAKWNWTGRPSVIPLPTRILTNDVGAPTLTAWRFQGAQRTETGTLALAFDCVQLPGLSLKSVWWAASPSLPGPVQHTFQIHNKTASDIRLSRPYLEVIVQANSGRKASLWTFGDQAGSIQKHGLTDGFTMKLVSNNGKAGQPMPFALVDDSGAGGLYLGMEDQTDFLIAVDAVDARLVRADARYLANRGLSVPAGSTVATPPTYSASTRGIWTTVAISSNAGSGVTRPRPIIATTRSRRGPLSADCGLMRPRRPRRPGPCGGRMRPPIEKAWRKKAWRTSATRPSRWTPVGTTRRRPEIGRAARRSSCRWRIRTA